MSGGRHVRLTFPAVESGLARIMADGKHQVGFVLGEFCCHRAVLWVTAGVRPENMQDVETVTGKRLADLRETLRNRVAVAGPWWR